MLYAIQISPSHMHQRCCVVAYAEIPINLSLKKESHEIAITLKLQTHWLRYYYECLK